MGVTPALLHPGLRALNRVGEGLERAGVELVSLDEQRLLDAACRETGIPSFGDEGLVAAVGAHAYWVGHLALRLRHQSGRSALFDDTL